MPDHTRTLADRNILEQTTINSRLQHEIASYTR